MRLANPPIVEVAIEFQFDVLDSPPWKPEAGQLFLRELKSFPHIEPAPLMPSQMGVKARNAPGNRSVSVGDSVLVVGALRGPVDGDRDYPGYEALIEECKPIFDKYLSYFDPARIRSVGVHYNNIVKIPLTAGNLNLDDYVTISIKLPPRFDAVINFELLVGTAWRQGMLFLGWRKLPSLETNGEQRFQMEWHANHPVDASDWSVVKEVLDGGHRVILDAFRGCFTEEGWSMFRPQ